MREVGEVGEESFVTMLVVVVNGFSKREIRPREPSKPLLLEPDCCAFSASFCSSDRCDSSPYGDFDIKSFESSRISTSFVSFACRGGEREREKNKHFGSISRRISPPTSFQIIRPVFFL